MVLARIAKTFAASTLACAMVAACSSSVTSSGAWRLVQSGPTSSAVVVEYFHGMCDSLTGATVKSATTSVRITLHIKTPNGACPDALVTTFVRVRLGAPLGSRTVLGECVPARSSLCQPTAHTPSPVGSIAEVGP